MIIITAAYVRYRYLIHMRMITGLYSAYLGFQGEMRLSAILPYNGNVAGIRDVLAWEPRDYRQDYVNYIRGVQ